MEGMSVRPWTLLFGIFALIWPAEVDGQFGVVEIETHSLVESDAVHAGTVVNAALQVRLQEGFHVNSNNPLDEALIPTVLMIDPPAGVTVREVVYPEAGLLEQVGVDEPLAVFEETFVVGVVLGLPPNVDPGSLSVPGALRYQACDETMCYMPATVDVAWNLEVVP
ncbi:MAG TPA: hypothetical protein EYO94_07075, partial [Acidobacteria bacterium]|nr:hypothetical protein [Acidobacteriota bacterium]